MIRNVLVALAMAAAKAGLPDKAARPTDGRSSGVLLPRRNRRGSRSPSRVYVALWHATISICLGDAIKTPSCGRCSLRSTLWGRSLSCLDDLALGIVSVGVFGTRPASTRIQIEDITMDVN